MNIKHTITTLSFLAVTITIVITAALLNTASAQTVQKQSESEALLLSPTVSISIDVDGTEKYYDVPMGSIDNALSYLNITLSDDDIINADLSDTVHLGQKIKIDRVNYSYYPTHEEIPYTTVVQESSKLFVGQTKVYQQGKSGSTEYIYKDKYVNGELISHKCIKQQVLTYPTDKIIVKGNRNIDIINKSYNNKTSYLVKTKYDNKDFKLPMVKLSDEDREMLERIVTGEFGGSYVGSCLIAQSIKCAIVYDGYTSVSAVIKGMGYVGSTANRSQNAVNAVKYIFDDNNLAVRHRLFYMCTKDYYDSTPGNFHSTQSFILQYENVLFFDRW
jgi:ABC-type antimicrobial peptide transport system permease subunit